jgi:hypothetical protein
MRPAFHRSLPACAALLANIPAHGYGVDLAVVSVSPPRHKLNVLMSSQITVTFDQPVLPASIGPASFWAFGKWSGTVQGSYVFSNGNQTVTLVPQHKFFPGEQVMVILSHDIVAEAGPALRSAGYSWQFWTAAASAAPLAFFTLDAMTTRTVPQITTRSYGGVATDLDSDGWPDLTIVNEDTADLRVFMNLANGTGLYAPFIQPTFPIGFGSSPSEPSDFNHDGRPDICVAEVGVNRVGVLLGNGDGTYGPQQQIIVGSAPRGIAALDADGDGDVDIVNTNNGSSNLTIMFNNGSGVFGTATSFEGGAVGEWALAAADMNDDGILDLVIGARSAQTIIVRTGNGNGTFSLAGTQSSGGQTWMLVTGDVDGDGDEDVAACNSGNNNAAILRGNNAGALAAPQIYATDPFALAIDLGDLDGDGDLDMVTSSFSGDWWVFTNNGLGTYSFNQELLATQAASCALPVDIDNDGDLDLALVDEIEDEVILALNGGTHRAGDLDDDGIVGILDFLALLAAWGPCPGPCPPFCPADVDFDCNVGITDFLALLGNWG